MSSLSWVLWKFKAMFKILGTSCIERNLILIPQSCDRVGKKSDYYNEK